MRRLSEDERHCWLKMILKDSVSTADFFKAHGLTAKNVMKQNVVSVKENTGLNDVAHVLETNRIKPTPVVDGDKIVRIIKSL
jgi:predicted transcriptional regulator